MEVLAVRDGSLDDRVGAACGVQAAADTVGTTRLPPADEEAIAVPPASSEDELDEEPHEVLGVALDAPAAAVKGAYRGLLKERHPDHGGTEAEFHQLQKAKAAMLDE
ncbi:DnaJ domain-containing protein [Natrinema zhouii]|uniref:DnaJ domain-containing protein n=1 Tax=Natrinema zhouii TaxID=1710539 RepID=A0A7D6CNT5_9EURY|nr:DnaJ domain-containing protein [Natrinema zhouii]QLK25396.1 DnaJ domain-containing protein [Natrinema zhouii]